MDGVDMSYEEFETTCCDIPCLVRVTSWESYVPARVSGPVESCYPAEGGCGNWELLDLDGKPSLELDELVRRYPQVARAMDQEVFEYMEGV
jgi:hypothetical protein